MSNVDHLPRAWIYKCSADSGYSWVDGGFFNRKGIERVAGNSYGVPEKEYRRLIG